MTYDFNCYIGHWPFHRLRRNSFADLRALHEKNGIDCGYVSNLNSIFYNDPYEGELELAAELKGSNYKHVMTINPLLPGWRGMLERGVRDMNIAGVKVFPGFHNYSLVCDSFKELCNELERLKLPLFIVLRMEDARAAYMFKAAAIKSDELEVLASERATLKIVICSAYVSEINSLMLTDFGKDNFLYDSSGLKDELFGIENFQERGITKSLIYGSAAPLICLESTLLRLNMERITPETRDAILCGKSFFN